MCGHKHSETTFWEEILTDHGHRFWKESHYNQNHTKLLLWPGFFYYNGHLVWLHGLQEQERRAGQTLPVSVCRFQHVYTQEQGLNLERNNQRCGMQVIRGRNPPPPPPSCCKSKNQQEVSVCVSELPPLASSYRQLQVCRIEHLDSETHKKLEITDGFPLCPRTALVEQSRLVLTEQGEPAASYR